jgi:hypothetical protein
MNGWSWGRTRPLITAIFCADAEDRPGEKQFNRERDHWYNRASSHVAINLNGFTLAQAQAQSIHDGIDISADNVTVRNGTISGFQSGISLQGSEGKAQDLKLLGNISNGVLLISGDDNAVVNRFITGPPARKRAAKRVRVHPRHRRPWV